MTAFKKAKKMLQKLEHNFTQETGKDVNEHRRDYWQWLDAQGIDTCGLLDQQQEEPQEPKKYQIKVQQEPVQEFKNLKFKVVQEPAKQADLSNLKIVYPPVQQVEIDKLNEAYLEAHTALWENHIEALKAAHGVSN